MHRTKEASVPAPRFPSPRVASRAFATPPTPGMAAHVFASRPVASRACAGSPASGDTAYFRPQAPEFPRAPRVLVADRDDARLDEERRALADEGLAVTISGAEDDLEGQLALLLQGEYPEAPLDALILEERTSSYDGVELTEALREGGCDAQVFLVADDASPELVSRAEQVGARVVERRTPCRDLVDAITLAVLHVFEDRPTVPYPFIPLFR